MTLEERREKKRLEIKKYRNKKYDVIKRAKDVPCADCGIQYPFYVMDFDHRDPKEKLFTISSKYQQASMNHLLQEIAKCDIVCSNCHRERTWNPKKSGDNVQKISTLRRKNYPQY